MLPAQPRLLCGVLWGAVGQGHRCRTRGWKERGSGLEGGRLGAEKSPQMAFSMGRGIRSGAGELSQARRSPNPPSVRLGARRGGSGSPLPCLSPPLPQILGPTAPLCSQALCASSCSCPRDPAELHNPTAPEGSQPLYLGLIPCFPMGTGISISPAPSPRVPFSLSSLCKGAPLPTRPRGRQILKPR